MPDNMPKSFKLENEPRARWNVIDMITVVAGRAVPAYLFMDIDMTFSEKLRQKYKSVDCKVTVTAMLLKAIAIAQRAHPASRTIGLPFGKRAVLNEIVAGFTVERLIDSQPAVFFGSIESPDTKSLEQISEELQAHNSQELDDLMYLKKQHWFNKTPYAFRQMILWLAMRFPAVRLSAMKATFGLSSLGKLGMKSIIPPVPALRLSALAKLESDQLFATIRLEIRPIMSITLNFDHRILDGAPAARFLSDVRELMEGGLEKYLVSSEAHVDQKIVAKNRAVPVGG